MKKLICSAEDRLGQTGIKDFKVSDMIFIFIVIILIN